MTVNVNVQHASTGIGLDAGDGSVSKDFWEEAHDISFDGVVTGDVLVGSGTGVMDRVAVGTSGQALVSNGTTMVMGRPKGTPVDFGFVTYTAGDLTVTNNQVWSDLGVTDITLSATAGDIIEVGVAFGVFNTTAQSMSFDCATVVSGSVVNQISNGAAPSNTHFGVAGWRAVASTQNPVSGSVMYQLQSGDVSGGNVVLRMRVIMEGSIDRQVNATADRPFHWWAKNLGPAI